MIMSNTSTIHNLRLLSTVFESDENAYQRICDCYREEGMIYLFDNFERLFSVAEKFEQETKDNFFEYVFNEKNTLSLKRRFFFRYTDEDTFFYMQFFAKMWDYKKVIQGTSKNDLLELFRKYHHRDYIKRTQRTEKNIKKFSAFPMEQQDKLVEIMFSTLGFYY